ncbi:O-antigen ligase family protein [Altererythrobacter sp. ZODW24]|uniref:O-antigen ligase family protein n=1 Tax=Altererythrobacter sp. ZODW24 TaxID=2185142 RepID=UPI0013B3AEED|nr:O-antigen ligase family protein [Altererythrobacter sp. ZODW24]
MRDKSVLGLLAFLLFAFILGGGSRYDILSLPILRGGAILFAAAALYSITRSDLSAYRSLVILFGMYTLWMIIQLIPLPPGIWTAMPGRELEVQAAEAVGLAQPWRPINTVPWRGTNALLALTVPWALILIAARTQLSRQNPIYLAIACIGIFSAVMGFLQILGPPSGPLYPYRITSGDSANGLFSNRNHHAAFLACCLPMITLLVLQKTQSSEKKRTPKGRGLKIDPSIIIAAMAAFLIVAGILTTGSRGGMLVGILAIVASFGLFITDNRRRGALTGRKFGAILFGFGGIMTLAMIAGYVRLNVGVQRLTELDQSSELRFKVWQPIANIAGQYIPLGSGFGSFVEVYEISEPEALLGPSYLNHAHNDYLEVAMTGGLPALAILAVAMVLFLRTTWRTLRSARGVLVDRTLALMSAINIAILAIFSLFDYPLRTPSLSAFFVLSVMCLIWASRDKHEVRENSNSRIATS